MNITEIRPGARSTVTIERLARHTRVRGAFRDLLVLGLVDASVLAAGGAPIEGGPAHRRWRLARVADTELYDLEIRPGAPPTGDHPSSAADGASDGGQSLAEARAEVLRVVEQYTLLGLQSLDLLQSLLRQAADTAEARTGLLSTVDALKRVYGNLAQHTRTTLLAGPSP